MIGESIGEYRILKEIGRSALGVVYLAEHPGLKKKYALRILPEEAARRPGFAERFYLEARALVRLDHPHIVRVLHMGEKDGVYFLVMDYVAGPGGEAGNLRDHLIDRGGRIPPGELREIILQVCRALQYAHNFRDADVKEGVIHRDLKPPNILIQGCAPLTAGGESPEIKIKVSDFGLARILGDEYVSERIGECVSLSLTGRSPAAVDSVATRKKDSDGSVASAIDSYDYMSPEIKEGRPVDARTDIYSLGVVIYYLLTGRKPAGFPRPPSELVPGLLSGWDTVVSRCLQEDPDDRYQSVGEAAAAIGNISRGKTKSRWGKAAGLLAAAGLIGGYFLMRSAGKPPGPIPSGPPVLTINTNPPAARVFLDSQYRGETPIRVEGLAPGKYQLVLENAGYNPLVRMVEVKEGENEYSFSLVWMTGRLRVESEPAGAEIFLDGKPMGMTDQALPGISVGSHQLLLKKEGYLPLEKTVEVKEGAEVTVSGQLRPPPGKIMVQSNPGGASVFINGRDTGEETTLSGFEVDPGEVTVTVTRAGYESAEEKRPVGSGAREQFSFELKKTAVDLPPGLIDRGKGYYRFGEKNYPREVQTLPGKAGIEMVLIPPGEFIMGSPATADGADPDESPPHREVITRPFYLGKYEVTVGQFKDFVRRTGYQTLAEERGYALIWTDQQIKRPGICWKTPGFTQDNYHPVVLLEWDEAQEFCRWLGEGFRLPTEVEWEYACRAGTETRYYWGDDADYREICLYANGADRTVKEKNPNWGWMVNDCSDGCLETAPVGSFLPNDFRLYDMSGNVWEWCQDWYVPDGEAENVGVRGGSWTYGPVNLRSANRSWRKKNYHNDDIGFRVARRIEE